ncbi:GNAT family N-acetyltransferase [Shimia abyssi]|uniref:CelD/BcsL family acetyltransferase involved in cellulose biosynthesis n=1 Tax=Shimia abyssi TaxID=1662395 RepID=A0A2P8FJ24_9RHOB|nr:GNAT family N-acetyltransferase [Shimia abyssi]PSL21710.1 CelD/BcsL family acetyltransferase involved in cellulose biosynthesis [Shimia abyssi]
MKLDASNVTGSALHVDVVDTWAEFEALKPAWETLQSKDPDGTMFLNWDWMAEAFRDNAFRWSVLVVRAEPGAQDILCLLPLKYRVHWSRSKGEFHSEIEAGGRLLWSEYTGFLCDPRFEAQGIDAVAAKLVQLPWTYLTMRYVVQENRARRFLNALDANGCSGRFKDYMINDGTINNLLCPQVPLPDDFEDFLTKQISANRRQKWRRFMRMRVESNETHFAVSTPETAEQDIDTLLTNWMGKRGEIRGEATATKVSSNYRDVLMTAHKQGNLFLSSLCLGDRTLGALGHVVDRERGRVHFIVAGRDVDAKDPFIGAALHFFSIQWAIENGFTLYDFCHGNEEYKYSFGAQDHEVYYFSARRDAYNPHFAFDSISTGEALQRIQEFIKDGKTDRAMRACNQLSALLS